MQDILPQDYLCAKFQQKIINKCIRDDAFYGGYWSDGNVLVNLSNTVSAHPLARA